MANQLVTIFGGSGFIGRHLVRPLAMTGTRIRVAVRNPNDAMFLKPMGDVGQIQLVQANVRYPESVARAVEGADAVVNLVAVLQSKGKQTFQALHVDGAAAIAKAAAEAGVSRLVHVSAIGADPKARSDYSRTKGEGEAEVREAFPTASIVRPSIVFGPEDDFFNRFAALARISPFLPLIGGGETRFQPVYVGDVAAALVALASGEGNRDVYELGGPRVYTFEDIIRIVLKETERNRALVSIPFGMASFFARLTGWLPGAPITSDQVTLLKSDNVVGNGVGTLQDLGIRPDTVEAIVPAYLRMYRKLGQFDEPEVAAG